ncbi:hypothetical protein GGS23DRAFT_577198 [Durotheca rogersii]|uniref:uncharacterized protein n=1 Tax=Durotheca rogersii TaxID=419775 RepID=UPI00221EDDAD|nr:uncharacterized protein GGS23DRAFT_577198 [Durotheca rogersii]KAI5861142.1 hypothetical protein GGS23DRAFT_577198 [Durotheca rogersii]
MLLLGVIPCLTSYNIWARSTANAKQPAPLIDLYPMPTNPLLIHRNLIGYLHSLRNVLSLDVDAALGMFPHSSRKSPPSTPPNERDPPAGRDETRKTTGRLRSACDSCHQSKIRCSGGNPCSTCEWSQTRCTYSPGSRLGRPKGSKNKRSLMRENGKDSDKSPKDAAKSGADVVQWDSGQHQLEKQHHQQQLTPPVDSMSSDFDIDHEFDSAFADSLVADSAGDLMLDPNMRLIDSMRADETLNLQALLTETGSGVLRQPSGPYRPEALEFPKYDSGYGTGTVSPTTDASLPSPGSGVFPSNNLRGLCAASSLNPPHCLCLQKLVRLLYHLEDLRHSQLNSPSVDSVLRGVQLAEGPWKSLAQCNRCQNEDNQTEEFLLFALSIRILLSLVQKLNGSSPRHTDAPSEIAVSVGSFELTGDAKAEVISMAIRRALHVISAALRHVWERTGRQKTFPISELGIISSNTPPSPTSMHPGSSKEAQRQLTHNAPIPPNLGTENVASLLTALQNTMKAMEQELRMCA